MLDTLKHISKMPIKSDKFRWSGPIDDFQLVAFGRDGLVLNRVGGFDAISV